MNSYSDDIDSILDLLEYKYGITEKILEKRGILEYMTDRQNIEENKSFIIWAKRYKSDFSNKQHEKNYILKVLVNKMKHGNWKR